MNNADRPVTPIECEMINDSGDYTGLTKREHFAGLAMQALINDSILEPLEVSVIALEYADALLAELDK